ncbi:phage portal protein [Mesorhizobium sp.]|uniref:phage portal protein n=1 Tax=Mesorhizobium sp. TaxID=1871066 RepID=UPI0025C4B5A8|nr:phage portal protein [Mesorhizobium sp.]
MLDRLRKSIARAIAPGRGQPGAAYMRSQQIGASIFSAPAPALRDAADDVKMAWVQAASRAIDVMHNNGWISGVVDALMSVMIGDGLKPNFKPDMTWAGWDQKQTSEWARRAEKRFEGYASDPWQVDAGGRYALPQLQAAAVRQWFATGEIVGEIRMIPRPGVTSNTKLRLLPSHWLSQRSDITRKLDQGVFLDPNGAPAGYLFEIKGQWNEKVEVERAARDAFGRPIIVHVFDGSAGQIRGITPIAPVLRVLRDYDQLSNATLVAAMIQAIFAATVESEYPTSEVLDALKDQDEQDGNDAGSRFESFMDQKVGWHQNVNIDLGRNGKIAHMMMGETLKFNRSEHPNENYEAFANMLLREIARCAGALFEDLTGDYRGATYSSIRMGIAKQWPLLLYRRKHIPTPFSQRLAEAWLEEEIDRGDMEIPGGIDAFVANRASICRMDWRGPAKPVADEVKAAAAHQTYRNMGVITDEMICADLGVDHEDVYLGRAAEKAMREELGIHGGITNGGIDIDEMADPSAPDAPPENGGAPANGQ